MSKDTTANPVTGEIALAYDVPSFLERSKKWREVLGVLIALVALFVLLSLISYHGTAREGASMTGNNLVGIAGEWIAYVLWTLFGFAGYLLDGFLWIAALSLFFSSSGRMRPKTILGMMTIGLFA